MRADLDDIKRSEIMNYIAEVFYEEYKFLVGDQVDIDNVWVKSRGVNSRSFSKDVLDLSYYAYMNKDAMKEATFIHISRNSIYHQLPEFLFHPLTISEPSMSSREIVEAIRENRKKEEENIKFFIPFDTELFKEKVNLNNRHFTIFSNKSALNNIFTIAETLIDKSISFSKEQYYKLFLNLCNAESLKENLPQLENLLKTLLGYKVTLKYIKNTIKNSPFLPVGEGVLGYSFGTQGAVEMEHDNILATLILTESKSFKYLKANSKIVKDVLEFFVFSNRSIKVQYTFENTGTFVLGENYLGYDTAIFEQTVKN